MNWTPDPKGLRMMVEVLRSIQSPDNETQNKAYHECGKMQEHAEFAAYAALIFQNKDLDKNVRLQAGIMLKNYLKAKKNDMDDKVFVVARKFIEPAMIDPAKEIRRTAANIVAHVIKKSFKAYEYQIQQNFHLSSEAFEDWPNLIKDLLDFLEKNAQTAGKNEKDHLIDGPLCVIEMLSVDCGLALAHCKEIERLIRGLMFFGPNTNYSPSIRYRALVALHNIYVFQSPQMIDKIEQYCKLLLTLTKDNNIEIRRIVATCIIFTMNEFWHHYYRSTPEIFEFFLKGSNDDDEELSLECIEFWSLYVSVKDEHKDFEYFKQYLSKLCPVLVRRLKFTEDILFSMNLDNDHQSKPDTSENSKPRHYKNNKKYKKKSSNNNFSNSMPDFESDSDDDDDDDDDDGSDNDDMNGDDDDDDEKEDGRRTVAGLRALFGVHYSRDPNWNLRRASAQQLDYMSRFEELRESLLKSIWPVIKNYLNSSDSHNVEAGVLALGTLAAEQNYLGFDNIFNELVGILNRVIGSNDFLVRSMSCWTLSRFARMFLDAIRNNIIRIDQLGDIIKALLLRMKDPSKRVQKAACGAIATFAQYVANYLHFWLNEIMSTFVESFNHYKIGNFGSLVDVVVTVIQFMAHSEAYRATNLTNEINLAKQNNDQARVEQLIQERKEISDRGVKQAKVIDALIPPLLKRWVAFEKDFDTNNNNNENNNENDNNNNNNNNGKKNKKTNGFVSNEYDRHIYPVFEGLTQFITLLGGTEHFQQTYMPELFRKSLQLCINVKLELREWNELREIAIKELTSPKNTNNENKNNDDSNNNNNDPDRGRHTRVRQIYGRTVTIVDSTNVDDQVLLDMIPKEPPNCELWTCGLDILSVLCEESMPAFKKLAFDVSNETRLVEMIWCGMRTYESYSVQRNALALFGDLISFCPDVMEKHAPKFMDDIISMITPKGGHVSTNASWCIGQCIYAYRTRMKPFAQKILDQLRCILVNEKSDLMIRANVCITLGRLIKIFKDDLKQNWNNFARDWIENLNHFAFEDRNKRDAILTMLELVFIDPKELVGNGKDLRCVKALFDCMGSWGEPDEELIERFGKCVETFQFGFNNQWPDVVKTFHPRTQEWLPQIMQLYQQVQQQRQQHQQQHQQQQQMQQMQQNSNQIGNQNQNRQ